MMVTLSRWMRVRISSRNASIGKMSCTGSAGTAGVAQVLSSVTLGGVDEVLDEAVDEVVVEQAVVLLLLMLFMVSMRIASARLSTELSLVLVLVLPVVLVVVVVTSMMAVFSLMVFCAVVAIVVIVVERTLRLSVDSSAAARWSIRMRWNSAPLNICLGALFFVR